MSAERAFVVNTEAAQKRHLALVADDVLPTECPHCGSRAVAPAKRSVRASGSERGYDVFGMDCGNCAHFWETEA